MLIPIVFLLLASSKPIPLPPRALPDTEPASRQPVFDLPPSEGKSSAVLTTALAAERIVLPKLRGTASVEVDGLRSTVILRAPKDLGAIAARVSAGLGDLCPKWEVNDGRILLHCRTRQLGAAVVEEGGKHYLDLYELRGLPQAAPEDKLIVYYDLARAGAGGPCPGVNATGRGECLFKNGDRAGAFEQFKQAWDSTSRTFASLRLGDLAAQEGEMAQAALWWSRAGSTGPFGRLARGRLCELRGDCLPSNTSVIFDGGEIAEPMRTELALRGARVDMYAGRTPQAIKWLKALIGRGAASGGCVTIGQLFCRRLVLAALEDKAGSDAGKAALELFLMLPDRLGGPLAVEMARAAAERAAPLGAPVFAANLYASVAGLVPEREFAAHLLRIVELYAQGDDRPRAQLVLDYADTRLDRRDLATGQWAALRKQLGGPSAAEVELERRARVEREIIGAEASRDLADAVRVLARSRTQLP